MPIDTAIAPGDPLPQGTSAQSSQNALLPEESANLAPEEQFLQVTVNGDLPLLLPGTNLVEIMKLTINEVVPMFEMAPWVMGIYNWRGDMLWVADLGHFLGFVPWYHQAKATTRHTVVVIKPPYSATQPSADQQPMVGLVVSTVEAMVTYPTAALQPLPNQISSLSAAQIGPDLLPFLQGCCPTSSGQPRLVLDGTAVLAAMAQP
jgi:positive phototaxis protein PixI